MLSIVTFCVRLAFAKCCTAFVCCTNPSNRNRGASLAETDCCGSASTNGFLESVSCGILRQNSWNFLVEISRVEFLHTNFFLQLLYIKQTYVLKPFKGLIGGGVSGQSTCFGRQWLNTEIPNLNFLIERFDLMAIFWVK